MLLKVLHGMGLLWRVDTKGNTTQSSCDDSKSLFELKESALSARKHFLRKSATKGRNVHFHVKFWFGKERFLGSFNSRDVAEHAMQLLRKKLDNLMEDHNEKQTADLASNIRKTFRGLKKGEDFNIDLRQDSC